jgi:membrane-associated phospholipid phosphatase
MRVRILCVFLAASAVLGKLAAQAPDPIAAAPTPAADTGRQVSWRRMAPNLLSDQARIWKFPARVARGHYVWPTLAVVGATAALIATDAHTAPTFRNTSAFHGFNSVFTSHATDTGLIVAPVSLYAAGWLARKSYIRNTALLAGEAAADSEIIDVLAKDIDRRRRPASYLPGTNMSDSWFNSQGSWIRGNGSFPSGHTIAAFSIATVVARRYPRRRWVRYAAYGLAGAVAFSRLTLSAHFPSDVLMGAAMGYSISRFAVLRQ